MSSILPSKERLRRLVAPSPGESRGERKSHSSRTLTLAACGTALVMAVFSAFVVSAGDSVRAFHAGVAGEAWGLSGMSLGLAAVLLTAGALADDLGQRRVLRFSAGLLASASAVGALAPSMQILVAARVLQGVAGGGILTAGLGSIARTFPSGQARTHATAVWGAALGAGVTVGPLAAAGLGQAIGWRSGFWTETATATALTMAAGTLAEETRTRARRSLDLPGIVALGAAMMLVTAGLVETRHGWFATTTLVLFGVATLMLGAFAMAELRSPRPMLAPQLLVQPQFLASITGALFTGLAVVGLMSYAPALMQQALHISALASAAVLSAWSATSMVVALSASKLPPRIPTRTRLLIGLALAGVGEATLTGLGTASSWTRLVPGLFITGLGSGIVNAALGRIAVESVPPDRGGMGSGANNTARYLGGAAGAALAVSLATAGGADELINGWNTAALVAAALCALGAATVASCRHWRRGAARPAARPALAAVPAKATNPAGAGLPDAAHEPGSSTARKQPPPIYAPEDRMNPQLTYLVDQGRHPELICRAEEARVAAEAYRAKSASSRRVARSTPPRQDRSAQAGSLRERPARARSNPPHECVSCDP